MDDVTAVVNEPARLKCTVINAGDWDNVTIVTSGSDAFVVKRNESGFTENGNNVTVFKDFTLTQCNDAGVYTCVVDNLVSDTGTIDLTGKPKNVTLDLQNTLNEGQTTSAVCKAIGTADIKIELHVKKPLVSTYETTPAETTTSPTQDGDCLLLSTATFDFVPSFVDNGTEIKCVAKNTKIDVTSESKTENIFVNRGNVSFDSYEQTLVLGKASPPIRCTASNSGSSSAIAVHRRDSFGNDTLLISYDGNTVQYESSRIQNGAVSSTGSDLVLTFGISNVSCDDIGTYRCVVNNSVSILTSPDKTIDVERQPGSPVLYLDPHQTTIPNDPNAPSRLHRCSVNAGYPEGKAEIEILRADASMFEKISSTDLNPVSTIPASWGCEDTLRTISFGINFHRDMEGAIVRCVAVSADDSIRKYSDNATIELVPDDICDNLGSEKVTAHPNNCHKHVDCHSGALVVNQCGDKCFVSGGTFANCDDCSNVACPPPTTTLPPTTTSAAPSILTCGDISGYIDDAAFLQCQIASNDFDTIELSHKPLTSTALLPLGSLTKTSSVVRAADPMWTGLSLAYHTDGSTNYVNVTIPKVACAMSGAIHLNMTKGNDSSETSSQVHVLDVPRTPPAISLSFAQIVEDKIQTFKCEGEIGTDKGTMALEIFDMTTNTFDPVPSTRTPTDQKSSCMVARTIETQSTIALSRNGTVARCSASLTDSVMAKDVTLVSDNATLLVIPSSVCGPNDTKVANPYDCYRFVTCGDGVITDQPCGALCFNPTYKNCSTKCDHCSQGGTASTSTTPPAPNDPYDCSNYVGAWFIPPVDIYPAKCDQFVWCANGVKAKDRTCLKGQYFTNFTQSAQTCTSDYGNSLCASYGELPSTTTEPVTTVVTSTTPSTTTIQPDVSFDQPEYIGVLGGGSGVTMTCRIITSSWNFIDVIRLDPAATLVARVDGSMTTQPFAPRITAALSEGDVVVDFTTVECEDEGTYICVLNATAGRIQSPDAILQARRLPSVPKLQLKGHQIVGSAVNHVHKHNCTGDVGYPAGEFKVQYAVAGSSVFTDLSVSSVQTAPSTWLCNSTKRTMDYVIDFQSDMEGGTIRCAISSSANSLTTYSNNASIELIPGDICTTTELEVFHHPTNCKKYVTCYGSAQGFDNCNGKCVKIEGNAQSCVDCSEDVCPKPVASTTTPVTTTSGPSFVTCGDISGYIDDAAFLQCQIVSNDFDNVAVSHTTAPSTGSVVSPLGSVTKTSAVVTTTDAVWSGLVLAYHTAGSLEYINVTIPKVACAMSGTVHFNLTNGNYSSVTTSQMNVLDVPRIPSTISLAFAETVEDGPQNFNCHGEIGTDRGTMTLEILNRITDTFVPIPSTKTPTDQQSSCMVTRTLETASFIALSQNGTVARCSASLTDSVMAKDVTVVSDNVTLLVIPSSVCGPNDTKVANPYDCYRFVTCGDGIITDQPCGALCFNPNYKNCSTNCDHCSQGDTSSSSTTPSSETTTVSEAPNDPYDCSNYAGQWYIPPVDIYPAKCDQFVWCANGVKTATRTCPQGQYFTNFTESAQTCTSDYENSLCASYGELPSTTTEPVTTVVTSTTPSTTTVQPDVSFDKPEYIGVLGGGSGVTMTCRIITSSWNFIDVIRLDPAATDVLVARVDGSMTTQPFAPRITAALSGGDVVVDFTTVECEDEGTYICVLNATAGRIQSPDTILLTRRPPSVPKLQLKGHQIVGSAVNHVHKHNCTGDAGYPAGEFKVQYAVAGSSVFTDLSVSSVQTTPSDWLCNSTERTMEYVIDFQSDMEGGTIRCAIYNSANSLTTYSSNATIELIPVDICATTELKVLHHPNNCKKYVTCYGSAEGFDNCNGKCVKIEGNAQSCVDCSEDVCPKPDASTTTPATTTSGPSSLTCGDISEYIDDAAFLQCQIVSNDFDAIALSHTSAPSTGSVLSPLGIVTKASADVTTTDPVWSGLVLAYHTAGALEYINVTIPKIDCAMSGTIDLNLTKGNTSSVTSSQINVLAKPTSKPTLVQNKYLDGAPGQIECKGDVGNPAVQMGLQVSNGGLNNSFVALASQPYGDDIKDGCTLTRTIRSSASLSSMNGTEVKCVTSYSNIGSNQSTTLESNSLNILLISGNICDSVNATFILHPYDCHRYIQCGDGTTTESSCAATTCFTIPGNNCDNDCSRCP